MNIPDGLPTLSRGCHQPGGGQACAMEYVSIIAGLDFTDQPECTDPVVRDMVISINDMIEGDAVRAATLTPILHRIAACSPVDNSPQIVGDLMRSRRVETTYPTPVSKDPECDCCPTIETFVGPNPTEYVSGLVGPGTMSTTHVTFSWVKDVVVLYGDGSPAPARAQTPEKAVEFLTEVLDALDKERGTEEPEPYAPEFITALQSLLVTA